MASSPNHATPRDLTDVVTPFYLATLRAIAVTLLWFCAALVAAAGQPRRDERAATRLRALRQCAKTTGCVLVEIRRTGWPKDAGHEGRGRLAASAGGSTHR